MVGITLFELVTDSNPFDSAPSSDDTFDIILEKEIQYKEFNDKFEQYIDLVRLFLNKDYKQRWKDCSNFRVLNTKK